MANKPYETGLNGIKLTTGREYHEKAVHDNKTLYITDEPKLYLGDKPVRDGGGSIVSPFRSVVLADILPAPTPVIALMNRLTDGFSLDTSRIGTGGTLYDTDGNAIGTASVQSGSAPLSELVYPVNGGLHFDGRALLTFPIILGRRFTVILRIRDFVRGAGQVHGFMRFSDGSIESVLDDGAGGYLYWYLVRQSGGSGQAAYNGAEAQNLGDYYRYFDRTIQPDALYEQRYVCDGQTVAMYLDGVLKSRESAAPVGYPNEICIGFPSSVYAAQDTFVVEEFSILPEAQTPADAQS